MKIINTEETDKRKEKILFQTERRTMCVFLALISHKNS